KLDFAINSLLLSMSARLESRISREGRERERDSPLREEGVGVEPASDAVSDREDSGEDRADESAGGHISPKVRGFALGVRDLLVPASQSRAADHAHCLRSEEHTSEL